MILPLMDDRGGMKKRPVLQPKRLHRGFRLDVQLLSGLALHDPTDLQLVGQAETKAGQVSRNRVQPFFSALYLTAIHHRLNICYDDATAFRAFACRLIGFAM